MDDLEWHPCSELLDDVLKNPKVQLPQLIRLGEEVTPANGGRKLSEGQMIVIHSKNTFKYLLATNEQGTIHKIPLQCPFKIKQKLPPGKEKNFNSIMDLAKSEPLPKFVEVTDTEEQDRVKKGDRLKVVIVEKSGSNPSFIHFRTSSGKHIKLPVDQKVSFTLAANVMSELTFSQLAHKTRELPIIAEFIAENNMPDYYRNVGAVTISKLCSEHLVLASVNISGSEHAFVFPLNLNFKFHVNSKLKLEKDESYRDLCQSISKVDADKILKYLDISNPEDDVMTYVIKYKTIMTFLGEKYEEDKQDMKKRQSKKNSASSNESRKSSVGSRKNSPETNKAEPKQKEKEIQLKSDAEQQLIIKKKQKEHDKQLKAEKERSKAEKKKEKKEKKEKEKEEKKKRKISNAKSDSDLSEQVDDNLYVAPQSPITSVPQSEPEESNPDSDQHSQWAMHLMKKVKKVGNRTKSIGRSKPKKRGKLTKDDIHFDSPGTVSDPEQSVYSGLNNEYTSDGLYETLPCDAMAYESLDLVREAQRSLATNQELSHPDSGFDELDQAKIKEWREQMAPPPLPGNHPHQDRINANNNSDELYETAVDTSVSNASWNKFFSVVEQSAKEIGSWDMEDVENCLDDLKLGKYRETFSDSQIDGQLLLDLDESVLVDLGLTPFEARKLRKFTFGWRPDIMRPENYPKLEGFDNPDPSHWSEKDVTAHLKVIDMKDFAQFCEGNQVNGDLLKDICIDQKIMDTIILTRDKKLKTVKIKNYVIDQWRPKKKGEGNYTKVSDLSSNPSSPTSQGYKNNLGQINSKKPTGDAPLIARMKQQLSEKSQ